MRANIAAIFILFIGITAALNQVEVATTVTTPILIVAVSLAGRQFKWTGVLIASAVLTVFCWLVFIKGLALTIPLWPAIGA